MTATEIAAYIIIGLFWTTIIGFGGLIASAVALLPGLLKPDQETTGRTATVVASSYSLRCARMRGNGAVTAQSGI